MIDTKTLFSELAKVFHVSPDDFFCRISMAKYLENNFKKVGLPWNWMCKVGLKDNSFDARLTNLGVKERTELLSPKFSKKLSATHKLHNKQVGKQVYQLLNSYDEYLNEKMHPLIIQINQNH